MVAEFEPERFDNLRKDVASCRDGESDRLLNKSYVTEAMYVLFTPLAFGQFFDKSVRIA